MGCSLLSLYVPWASLGFEFLLQKGVCVLNDEENKGKIGSEDSVMRARLEEGQQNCGDLEMTQAVRTTFAKLAGRGGGWVSRTHRSSCG